MDTFTQIALGATIGEAGFRGRLGRKAPIVGGICGALPDADALFTIGDRWGSLVHHRAESHSLLLLPLAAFAVGALAWLFAKREGGYLTWVHLAFWALVTHPLLDLCTPYGTQLFAPFSRTRYALDAVAILDPIYSLPLFVATALALRARAPRFATRAATATLVVTTLYLGYGYVSTERAITVAAAQLRDDGVAIAKIRAFPTMLNSELHRVVARDVRGDYHVGYYSSLAPRPIAFSIAESHTRDPRVRAALDSARGRTFRWFTMDMTWAAPATAAGEGDIVLHDERYGLFTRTTTSILRAEATVDEGGTVRDVRLDDWGEGVDYGTELGALFHLLTTARLPGGQLPAEP